jgi:diphthamide biosynthesis methyltransferase
MRNIYIAAFATLVALQQAVNPVQLPIAEQALAQSQSASTVKENYDLNLNTNTLALELKDTRPTFDDAVAKPLKAAQEAKAKADAKAKARASVVAVASTPKAAPLVIGGSDAWAQLRFCEAGGD